VKLTIFWCTTCKT